ncbi:YebO family protein [[Enterobacter] lignolyticus]|nr:YebO family protein [[Enterobacter] lignolyticus]
MMEVISSGVMGMAPLVMSLLVVVVGLVLWFFVRRASARSNEQIELLEALLDQQKRQTALLRRLCEANEPEKEASAEQDASAQAAQEDEDDGFIRLVAER